MTRPESEENKESTKDERRKDKIIHVSKEKVKEEREKRVQSTHCQEEPMLRG